MGTSGNSMRRGPLRRPGSRKTWRQPFPVALSVAGIVEPPKTFAFVTPSDLERVKAGEEGLDTTWAFVLKPSFGGGTRLVARLRGAAFPGLGTRMANYLFWEPAHFVMERKMLLTIKKLAEKQS
jgi:hypothetical protein